MAGHIGERFLGDAKEHRSPGCVQFFNLPAKAARLTRTPVRVVKLFMNECRAGISPRSSNTAGRNSRANRCTMSTDFSTSRWVLEIFSWRSLLPSRGPGFQGSQLNIDARQGLGNLIMQFAADPLALFLLGRQKLAGQPPHLFLHVPRLLQQLAVVMLALSEGLLHRFALGDFPLQPPVGRGQVHAAPVQRLIV